MTIRVNKTSRQVQLQQILSGIAKHFAGVTSVTLGKATYSPAALAALVQQILDAMAVVAQANAVYREKVQLERDAYAKAAPVLRLLKSYVVATNGDGQDSMSTLTDFGYTPRKLGRPKTAAKAEAEAKAAATRHAHHPAPPQANGTTQVAPAPAVTPKA